jgi:hypothetical protein
VDFFPISSELLKAVQTIPPQNTHTLLFWKERKKKTLILLFFLVCGEEFKKVLSFSAFSFYQLLLFLTLCVCVCCENYKNKEDASCSCCFFFGWRAEIQGGRTLNCLKQLKNIFLSCESSSKSSKTATTTATTKKTFDFIWSSPPTFLTADAQTAGSAGPATFFSISHLFGGFLFLVF